MAISSTAGIAPIEKLVGRENFNTWKFAMRTYLEHEDLWECIEYKEEYKDVKKDTRARTKIILSVDPIIYVHIQEAKTAKEVWQKLICVFEDSGLSRRVGLLRKLTTTKLSQCKSVDEYVNTVITTAHKINGIGFHVSDEWIGTLLLTGLPDEYRPMIMGLENSGLPITADSIKTKILQDIKIDSSSADLPNYNQAFLSKRQYHNQKSNSKGIRCFKCNGYGHIAVDCPKNSKAQKFVKQKSLNKSAFYSSCTAKQLNCEKWYIDSGASVHMTNKKDWISGFDSDLVKEIVLANNEKLNVAGKGQIEVKVSTGGISNKVDVHNVVYVPELATNLLSVSQITNKGNVVIFSKNNCKIYDKNNKLIATASNQDNMYVLDQPVQNIGQCNLVDSSNKFEQWHRRLGHMNINNMMLLKNGYVNGVSFSNEESLNCLGCAKGKQHRNPFPKGGSRATKILELVHSDVCGPMETESIGGNRYFLTFIDDYSRKIFVYFIKNKDAVYDCFEDLKFFAEKQSGQHTKILRTDNGSEYVNHKLSKLLRKAGIRHQKTVPYTPEQNGLAERCNRTIVEKARSIIHDANLDKTFWAEATATAVHLVNRSPHKGLERTPEDVWSNRKPNLSYLRTFGCRCFSHIPKQLRKKWDPKCEECIFVGYEADSKGYRLYLPSTKSVIVRRDAIFIENQINSCSDHQSRSETHFQMQDDQDNVDDEQLEILDEETEPESSGTCETELSQPEQDIFRTNDSTTDTSTIVRRSSRLPKPKILDDYIVYSAINVDSVEPCTIDEAVNGNDSERWIEAMNEEFRSLKENSTWQLTDLPIDKKAISCKWVFKFKRNEEGKAPRYKARLVIRGCAQRKGIDFEETYSPVVRYSFLRFLIALAAKYNLEIDQMDAVTAFLQGELKEQIYMSQPEGFVDKNHPNKVCKLQKALYGLKQSSLAWNRKLDRALKEIGLQRSQVDPCIYFKIHNANMIFVAVYVDDLMIFSNDREIKNKLKTELSLRFKMKDLGTAKHCLGLRITRDKSIGMIAIDQETYIEDILRRYNMSECNPVSTPLELNTKLSNDISTGSEEEKQSMRNIPYREAIGSLMFVAQCTRPDICYAVNSLSRFSNNPNQSHWSAVKRIFRYLRGTSSAKMVFVKDGNSDVIGYSDSDWANDVDERKSVTGYLFKLQSGAISWGSKRQQTVALSTTEAEYMAMSSASQEAMWIRYLCKEFRMQSSIEPTKLFCDNQSAIYLGNTNSYHARSKHIDVRHHFVREKVESGEIQLVGVGTDDMIADGLTKALPKNKHTLCMRGMGVISTDDAVSSGDVRI